MPPPLRAVGAAPGCSGCVLRELCLPHSTPDEALDAIVTQRLRVRRGETLVRRGDPFTALYAIRSGSCKSVVTTPGGQEQVAGYHIAGDVMGAEGIYATRYDCTVAVLEDSEFCVMPFDRLSALARDNRDLQRSVNEMLSREISRERRLMLMLGTMRAEQRLAAFLLDLADRYRARGYSSSEFILRMTREEIGGHLGLKLETVSRLFSRFHQDGFIRVQGKEVKLIDRAALQQLVDTAPA
ncbi:MAG: helix-turn-helix domain-containing protein [Burkholderiales bacterium]|nr:helix-turn-helix domain-containing protein [Burkholderiales bacterium]